MYKKYFAFCFVFFFFFLKYRYNFEKYKKRLNIIRFVQFIINMRLNNFFNYFISAFFFFYKKILNITQLVSFSLN